MKYLIQYLLKSSAWENITFCIKLCFAFAYIFLILIVCVISWPITIPVLAAINYINTEIKKNRASRSYCTNCNKILGNAAIKLAGIEWDKFILEHPLAQKYNTSMKNDAICIYCGTKFNYLKLSRKFVVSSEILTD